MAEESKQSDRTDRTDRSSSEKDDKSVSSRNPFVNFLHDFRKKNQHLYGKQMMKQAGEEWRKMSSEEKQPYIDAAKRVSAKSVKKRGRGKKSKEMYSSSKDELDYLGNPSETPRTSFLQGATTTTASRSMSTSTSYTRSRSTRSRSGKSYTGSDYNTDNTESDATTN